MGGTHVKKGRIETSFSLNASETAPTWVRLCCVGDYVYQGEAVPLTEQDLIEIASETRRWIKDNKQLAPIDSVTSYYPPLLKEHQRSGERYGSVVDFEVRGEGDKAELWGKIRPLQEIYWGIEDGRFLYVSLRIVWGYTSAEGVLYAAIVEEVSLTGTPFFKNIGCLRDFFGISCSDGLAEELQLLFTDPKGDSMAMTETERQQLVTARAKAEAAESKNKELETRLAALELKASEPATPPATPPTPPANPPATPPATSPPATPPLAASDVAPTWFTSEMSRINARLTTIEASDPTPRAGQSPPPAPKDKAKPLEQRIRELQASENITLDEAVKRSMRLWPDEF